MASTHRDFMGAKLALFAGPKLLVLQRDDRPGLLWPGFWDLPGGGRENEEEPLQTVLRETREEFSVDVPRSHIRYGRAYTNSVGRWVWFFAGHMPPEIADEVVLGDEGQGWGLMTVAEFCAHDKVVPQFKARLGDYLGGAKTDHLQERPPAV